MEALVNIISNPSTFSDYVIMFVVLYVIIHTVFWAFNKYMDRQARYKPTAAAVKDKEEQESWP